MGNEMFYHAQAEAVGICRNCQKGICAKCAADLANGIACKGKCEREVADIIEMIQRNKLAYDRAVRTNIQTAVFWTVVGSISILTYIISTKDEAFAFFGVVFLVLAGWNLNSALKYKQISKVSQRDRY